LNGWLVKERCFVNRVLLALVASFVVGSIEVTNIAGGTSASDDTTVF
jgi:hypothetical protein